MPSGRRGPPHRGDGPDGRHRLPGHRTGRAPFVEVGSAIEEKTTVCIIEVMKLMSSVPAGVSGTIVEVCFENATPVQYGDLLFRVRPG